MIHKGCGGELEEVPSKKYEWDDEEGHHGPYPEVRCKKCGEEIVGDSMIILEGDE